MNSMLVFEVLRNGEVVSRELVPKVAKRSNSGQIPEVVPVPKQSCTGTAHQRLIGAGTDPSGTSTAQQNAIDTDTAMPKMPRLCSFCIFKPKFTHRLYRNLIK